MPPSPLLQIDRLTKRFPGVVALDAVSFEVRSGACHALLGENGAGKSTLGKLIAGIYTRDAGRILFADAPGRPLREYRPRTPLAAAAAGVRIVHQEPAFCRNLSIAENLLLGRLPQRAGFLRRRALQHQAAALLERVSLARDPRTPLAELSTGEAQLVQIAAAVGSRARLVIFDEPTSSLSDVEAERLFERIGELRQGGATILYVSHRLPEIRRLCDFVTVLRDGRHIATRPAREISDDEIVRLMVGRDVAAYQSAGPAAPAAPRPLLEIQRLTCPPHVVDVSLSVCPGEIVGLAGLVGSGRSELAAAVFGITRPDSGAVRIRGRPLIRGSPPAAIRAGIGLLPEDRQLQGLILSMTCQENLTLATLPRLARCGLLRGPAERRLAARHIAELRVRTPGPDAPIAGLSGGNQQKIALAKWLACACEVLMLDEPTRGVDVAAKAEIHALIGALAAQGRGVLLISSELPELLGLATRIAVMRNGRIVAGLPRAEATAERIVRHMAGVN